jgi:hypothetical protein
MSVGLFTGIETYNWGWSDFDQMISFCKNNSVDYVVLKIYEITQGEWYSGLSNSGASAVVNYIKAHNLDVLTYGFYYGADAVTECSTIKKYLNSFGKHCADIEGSFYGNPNNVAETFANLLSGHSGVLSLSTWANPVEHSWGGVLSALDPVVDIWMPQCYDDSLVRATYAEWPKTTKPIQPTYHLQNTPYVDAKSFSDFTLWEYQMALTSPTLLTNYVNVDRGVSVSNYPVNAHGAIFNGLQVSEFQPGHIEFACGAFSVSVCVQSSDWNKGNPHNTTDLIWWAETEYAKTAGDNSPSNTAGASIADMHTYLKDTNLLHWWDTNISTTSVQANDLETIKAAVNHGYPVIATVSEQSVFDMDLGRNPYWWGPSGNHILVWVGVSGDGNLLAYDCANVIQGDGNLQTPKQVQTWPRRYRNSSIDNQWATIIQMPWLPPIPSNDPISWPPYVPPTPPPPPIPVDVAVQVLWDPNAKQVIYMVNNQAVGRTQF